MAQRHPTGAQEGALVGDKIGERTLVRLAVLIGAADGGAQGDVGMQPLEQRRPRAGAVLPQDRSVGRLDQIDERAAVTARVRSGQEVFEDLWLLAPAGEHFAQAAVTLVLRDAKVASRDGGRRRVAEAEAPQAGVQAREHARPDSLAEL